MQITELISWSMILGTLFLHVAGIILALLWFFGKRDLFVFRILKNNGMMLAYFLSVIGLLGSLYYSEIVGYAPCVLCWYQRIFVYSNVFVLGLALYRGGDKSIIPYAKFLAIVGGSISVYHNALFTPFFKNVSTACSPFSNVSCTEDYFTAFGYINIPVIALTSFVATIIFLNFANKK